MRYVVDVDYRIGEHITTEARVYVVIGYEIVPGRATRYLCLHEKDGDVIWVSLYGFEIEQLRPRPKASPLKPRPQHPNT